MIATVATHSEPTSQPEPKPDYLSPLELKHRYLDDGINSLSDVELVELLLNLGSPKRRCHREAHQLIARHGSFQAIAEASPSQLAEIKGLGERNTICLRLFKDVATRYLRDRLQLPGPLLSSEAVQDYLTLKLKGNDREVFYVLYLDIKNKIRHEEELFQGTLEFSVVYIRELFKKVIQHKAGSIIIAHNHPSGEVNPSEHDNNLTKNLTLGCKLLGVRLLDHLIIGEDCCYSYADTGLLSHWQQNNSLDLITPP